MSVQSEINKATKALNEITDNLDVDLRSLLADTAQKIYDETERGADSHTITGALASAVFLRTAKDGFLVGIDTQVAPHVEFVHFPTKPHLIKPKKKKSLRWVGGNGLFRFSKAIQHPGYKGDPFFHDAVDSGMAYLDQQAQQLKLRD